MARISTPEREPNGRLKRPTRAEREAAQRRAENREKEFVLSQPHRRGETSQKCANALGRFCLAHKLREELYMAGEEYAGAVRRWRLAVANLKVEGHSASSTPKGEVTRDVAQKLFEQVLRAENVLKRNGSYPWVRHITVDFPAGCEGELPFEAGILIRAGLFDLAVHYGMLRVDNRGE